MGRVARLRGVLPAGAVALAIVLSGCAGPTVTDGALRQQAVLSSEAATAELETVDLAVRTQLRGDAWWGYTDSVVTDSERAISSVAATFGSRQPPSTDVDPLYDRTTTTLSDAAELVTDFRIAVRRKDTEELAALRDRVAPLSTALDEIAKAAG